jgi:uncharacterized membrane protein (UPF0182 family)
MLYVEPVYVQAAEGGYPLLRKVLVSFGTKVGFSDTLEESLAIVFGAVPSTPVPVDPEDPDAPIEPVEPGVPAADIEQALADAQRAYDDGVAALRNNDWAAYGEAQRRLAEAIRRAQELSGGGVPLADDQVVPEEPVAPEEPAAEPEDPEAPAA